MIGCTVAAERYYRRAMNTTVGIGILGAGTVGGTLIRRLVTDHAAIEAKTGLDLEVRRVAVRSLDKERNFEVGPGVLTDNPHEVVDDPTVGLIVEMMGGRDPAGDLVLAALNAGKPVVTANKELVAARGHELIAAAERTGVPLLFEAAVGGGIPIIRPLSETLAGEQIARVMGIVNGTTNFILTQMAEEGRATRRRSPRRRSSATPSPIRRPTSQVPMPPPRRRFWPAWRSALGLGSTTSTTRASSPSRHSTCSSPISSATAIKLLGVAEHTAAGVSARVHPVMLPTDHPLAAIRGATNAIFIEGPRSMSCSSRARAPAASQPQPQCSAT